MSDASWAKRRAIAACAGLTISAAGLTISVGAAPMSAQDYPSGNIRLIVNVAAGGVTDSLARIVGQGLW